MYLRNSKMTALFLLSLIIFLGTGLLWSAEPVHILTINVRTPSDKGENAWPNRRDFMLEVMLNKAEKRDAALSVTYDFIGTQETMMDSAPDRNQVQYIIDKMPQYDSIYLSREVTPDKGESMLLLWRKDRWKIDEKDQGTFWLSDTPTVPGSKTDTKAGCPRIVTYGLFHEINGDKSLGRKIYVCNTHFDHLSEEARMRAAKQVSEWVASKATPETPMVVMGDLNNGEKSPAIRFLQGDTMTLDGKLVKPTYKLIDTFRAVHPDATDIGTFNGFKEVNQQKIDYIFVTKPIKTISSSIIRTRRDGRWPTDHCPVEASIQW